MDRNWQNGARTIWIAGAATLFCGFLQLISSLGGLKWSFCGASLCGLLLPLLAEFLAAGVPSIWGLAALSLGASIAGVGLAGIGRHEPPLIWLSPLLAGVVTWSWCRLRVRSQRRCALCARRIASSALAFECPRCGLMVCEQTCWSFEYLRCGLCEQNRVPVLPPDTRWWERRMGARVTVGRCQHCLEPAESVDLRNCGKCGRSQCRACWDYLNGRCGRCQWLIADLPAELSRYLVDPEIRRSA